MARNTRIVIGLLVVGAIVIGALLYFAAARGAAQTAEAMASVVSAEREAKKGDDDTILNLSYPTPTGQARARARIAGVHSEEYPAGRQVRICYDPSDNSSVRVDDGPCR